MVEDWIFNEITHTINGTTRVEKEVKLKVNQIGVNINLTICISWILVGRFIANVLIT